MFGILSDLWQAARRVVGALNGLADTIEGANGHLREQLGAPGQLANGQQPALTLAVAVAVAPQEESGNRLPLPEPTPAPEPQPVPEEERHKVNGALPPASPAAKPKGGRRGKPTDGEQ
jgi:hypothetical protein